MFPLFLFSRPCSFSFWRGYSLPVIPIISTFGCGVGWRVERSGKRLKVGVFKLTFCPSIQENEQKKDTREPQSLFPSKQTQEAGKCFLSACDESDPEVPVSPRLVASHPNLRGPKLNTASHRESPGCESITEAESVSDGTALRSRRAHGSLPSIPLSWTIPML